METKCEIRILVKRSEDKNWTKQKYKECTNFPLNKFISRLVYRQQN